MKRETTILLILFSILLSFGGCAEMAIDGGVKSVCEESAAPYSLEEIEKRYHCMRPRG
jgi:hypothetical protein